MNPPKNWPENFRYLPIALPDSFHEVLLEAFLGTGCEEDMKLVVPLLDEQKVYPHMEIQIIDQAFCDRHGNKHLLYDDTKEVAGHKSRGVVATKDIPAGTVLGEYGGVLSFSLPNHPELQNDSLNPYLWQLGQPEQRVYVDGFKAGNELIFINDYHDIADTNNVIAETLIHRGRRRFCYITCAPIKVGEELLVNYHPNLD